MTDLITAEVGALKLAIQLPPAIGVTRFPAEEAHAVALSVPTASGRLVTVHFHLTQSPDPRALQTKKKRAI